ncbi:hypothetical protein FRB99_007144, partial [Tulasnella sp. 403]
MSSNPPQLLAVAAIVDRPPGSAPFIIDGPPGTGKTVVVVEAIRQLLNRNKGTRILVCTPSNSAANLITSRLADLNSSELFRLCASSLSEGAVPSDVLNFTYRDHEGFSLPGTSAMKKCRVIVSTCSSAIMHAIGMKPGHFSHVFIDEAGQGIEPELVVPIKGISNKRTNVILSGDPRQLGPVLQSRVASRLGLGTSLLERLLERDVYMGEAAHGVMKMQLTKNWRSHPAILAFPNAAFYNQNLEPCGHSSVVNSFIGSSVLPKPSFPVVFHGVEGKDQRDEKSPSHYNLEEVSVVAKYVDRLFHDTKRPLAEGDIGIISPYIAQSRRLRQRLNKYPGLNIGSVEEFQGQERKVIILTTTRSSRARLREDVKFSLGFLTDPRRMNVALTRAQAMLIVVGNPNLLGGDPLWRSFITFVSRNGGATGVKPKWDPKGEDALAEIACQA